MAKKSSTASQDGQPEAGASLMAYTVLSPIKIGGKRVTAGVVDLDPGAEDTLELIAFGAISDRPDPEAEKSDTTGDGGGKPQS